jgi:hypothetical protein
MTAAAAVVAMVTVMAAMANSNCGSGGNGDSNGGNGVLSHLLALRNTCLDTRVGARYENVMKSEIQGLSLI